MKIKSMTAAFGKLDHARLEPGPGLTVIYAPNEGGKSTWCAFWRAMLYGIDTRDRDKKGYLADKNRYQPWSGAPMEGDSLTGLFLRSMAARCRKEPDNDMLQQAVRFGLAALENGEDIAP